MDEQNRPPQPSKSPEPPYQKPKPQPNMQDTRTLKVAQNLAMVASLAGPVSIFIGGVFLSTAGLVCAIVALYKLNGLAKKNSDFAMAVKRLKRVCITAIVICGIALVLNAISAYLMYPMVLEALESGDYGNLGSNLGTSPDAPKGSSTWG